MGGDALILLTSMNVYVQSIRLKDVAKVIRTLAEKKYSNCWKIHYAYASSKISNPEKIQFYTINIYFSDNAGKV